MMPAAALPDFRQAFLNELLATERYLGQHNARKGRTFTQAVFDFACDIVGAMPEAFPAYAHPLLPQVPLRRAVFRREYVLLYQVVKGRLVFLYFHHTRRDISQQHLEL